MIDLKPSENNVPVKSKLQHPPGQQSGHYPGCQRVFFLSGDRDPAEREKKTSGHGSYKPHFHAILKTNTTPNRFLRDLFAFVIDMSARVATMRETVQKISQDEEE